TALDSLCPHCDHCPTHCKTLFSMTTLVANDACVVFAHGAHVSIEECSTPVRHAGRLNFDVIALGRSGSARAQRDVTLALSHVAHRLVAHRTVARQKK
ncbi:MAG: hypothetical protein LBS94_00090, partial [Prevotellaceae bacterium]|nr:hypothetical protein [Prevotellaceae bacterium]